MVEGPGQQILLIPQSHVAIFTIGFASAVLQFPHVISQPERAFAHICFVPATSLPGANQHDRQDQTSLQSSFKFKNDVCG